MNHSGPLVQKPDTSATRFWQKISLIAEISAACRQQKPERPSYLELLALIQKIIPFDAATLLLKNPQTRRLEPQAQMGRQVDIPGLLPPRSGDGSVNRDTVIRRPIVRRAGFGEDDFDPDAGFIAVMSVPLLIDDDAIGILTLGSSAEGVLVERHLKLMTIVADQLAVSIERLHRLAEIQAQNRALQKAQLRLKASQKQIVAAEKLAAVAELAASINHQINNPLAVIVGQVQCLMLQEKDLSSKAADRLRRIEQSSMRIAEINRRLLKLDTILTDVCLESTEDGTTNPEKPSGRRSR